MAKKLRTAIAAVSLMGSAALADCGPVPKEPGSIASEGSKLTSAEYEAQTKEIEAYSQAFAKYVQCISQQYNGVMDTWRTAAMAYQAKNAKK